MKVKGYCMSQNESRAALCQNYRAGAFGRAVVFLILLLGFVGIAPESLFAQLDTGGITGTVRDPAGAIIVGAKVTLTNDGTGVVASAYSTSTGTYVFGAVRPGSYTIAGDAAGFQKYIAKDVQVHVQKTVTIDIPLATGNVAQQVTLTAASPLLQAGNSAVRQTIDT